MKVEYRKISITAVTSIAFFILGLIGIHLTGILLVPVEPNLRAIGFIASLIFIFLSLCLPIYTLFQHAKLQALTDFPSVARTVKDQLGDLDSVRRELYKSRTAVETLQESVQQEATGIAQVLCEFVNLLNSQLQIGNELIQERQERGNAVRQIDEWQKRAIEFLQYLERTMDFPGLQEEQKCILERTANEFERLIHPLDVHVIRVHPGDRLDEISCRCVGAEFDAAYTGRVLRCECWGFQANGKILKQAEVIMGEEKPEQEGCVSTANPELPAPCIACEEKPEQEDNGSTPELSCATIEAEPQQEVQADKPQNQMLDDGRCA